jgi:GDPmannose 4,6-dehydratase
MSSTSSAPATRRKRALICGIGGQDGAFLARFLHDRDYDIWGTSRDAAGMNLRGLRAVGMADKVRALSMAPTDFRSVLQTLSVVKPDEIYNLAGQTSVGLSFEQPVETIESISIGTLNLLEVIRFGERPIRYYNAGSSECFGDTGGEPANEDTPFKPRSPYAVAKACAHNLVANYREAYGMHASTGILFNHESPLRPERFVTQKIVSTAARIAAGSGETLKLGNIDIRRDWGWAPEYVEAMWMMLQAEHPRDFVIATGRSISLEQFVADAFSHFGLDWRAHVHHDPALIRPSDIRAGAADPGAARQLLGWSARVSAEEVVARMCRATADTTPYDRTAENWSR